MKLLTYQNKSLNKNQETIKKKRKRQGRIILLLGIYLIRSISLAVQAESRRFSSSYG